MISRTIHDLIIDRLKLYPSVAIVGPRQCGKTTLAQAIGGIYYDLELETDQLKLDLEWDAREKGNDLLLLDEAQSWPEVFPRLRSTIDKHRKRNGRFLLLGSVSPTLMTQVSESLAGRLSIIELTPFIYLELKKKTQQNRLWVQGGYPDGGVLGGESFPNWQMDYLSLLSQRDLPTWGLAAAPGVTDRLLRMIAISNGQEWNASQIGKSLGLSYHTINHYLDYLEGAFLVRRLPAYHANIRKRLVKRPKVYWRDSGLLHALMQVSELKLMDQPWVGASWEGYVIEQILSTLDSLARPHYAYYLRTSDQHEIDLIIEIGSELWAIEVKLTAQATPSQMNRLNHVADLIKADRRILISQQTATIEGHNQLITNLPDFLNRL